MKRADILDNREKIFVQEYLVDLDVERAAVAAGYSATMARSKCYQWVSNSKVKPHVFAAVQTARKRLSQRIEITQDMVAKELALIAFGRINRMFDDNGSLIPIHELDDAAAATLSSVEVVTRTIGRGEDGAAPEVEYVHKIRTWDKVAALTKLGQHLGMFTERHELSGPNGAPLIDPQTVEAQRVARDRLIEALERLARQGVTVDVASARDIEFQSEKPPKR